MSRIDWKPVVARAAQLAEELADDGNPATLRQLSYILVSEGWIPNKDTSYKTLSSKTAQARRDGLMRDLTDRTRKIERAPNWRNPKFAIRWAIKSYRLDRTRGQEHQIWIGAEKRTMIGQLESWFKKYSVPRIALAGYTSQTIKDEVARAVRQDGRPAVFIYSGDFDPSGQDILRDFKHHTNCWDQVIQIAVHPEQIDEYGLKKYPGTTKDSRSQAFFQRHGRLVQVEVEAIRPDILRGLYEDAFFSVWEDDPYQDVLDQEEEDKETMRGYTK